MLLARFLLHLQYTFFIQLWNSETDWSYTSMFVSIYMLNSTPKGLNVSRLLIVNVIPFVTISNFFKWTNFLHYDIQSSRWITLDDSLNAF